MGDNRGSRFYPRTLSIARSVECLSDSAGGSPPFPAPRRALVVMTRRIGDVLMATPLLRSLRRAWPAAQIDVLLFAGCEGMLAHNPDVDQVLAVAERPSWGEQGALLGRLWRRYDIALSLLPGDRPTLYAWVAGRRRAGMVETAPGRSWKRRLLHREVVFDDRNTHTVLMNLQLADAVGAPRCPELVAAWGDGDRLRVAELLGAAAPPYAVLHVYPKFRYKMWREDRWIALGRWLMEQGLRLCLSGGGDADERVYVASVARGLGGAALNAAGRLSLSQTACLIAGARLYAGCDTAATHIAAAVGTPTVALYGPSNPVKWAPWPQGHEGSGNPFGRFGSQRSGNVWLVQGVGACVPCHLEGCERRLASDSDCLTGLPVEKVLAACRAALAWGGARSPTLPAAAGSP